MRNGLLICSFLAISFVFVQATDSEVKADTSDVKPWKKYDFKRREPEFLKEMSKEAKEAYLDIRFNGDFTKAEKTKKFLDWAKEYGAEEEMQKFLDGKRADIEKVKQERKENYKRLGELIQKADEILDDENNTFNGANKKLEIMMDDEDRQIAKAFQAFYPFIGRNHELPMRGREHGHGRHRFHHGRRFGRHIGGGARPRGEGIGSGIGLVDRPYGNEGRGIGSGVGMADQPYHRNREEYDAYGNRGHHHKKHHHNF